MNKAPEDGIVQSSRMAAYLIEEAGEKDFLLLLDLYATQFPEDLVQRVNQASGSKRCVVLLGTYDSLPMELLLQFDYVKTASTLEQAESVALETESLAPGIEFRQALTRMSGVIQSLNQASISRLLWSIFDMDKNGTKPN
jgi:hypothetical protein